MVRWCWGGGKHEKQPTGDYEEAVPGGAIKISGERRAGTESLEIVKTLGRKIGGWGGLGIMQLLVVLDPAEKGTGEVLSRGFVEVEKKGVYNVWWGGEGGSSFGGGDALGAAKTLTNLRKTCVGQKKRRKGCDELPRGVCREGEGARETRHEGLPRTGRLVGIKKKRGKGVWSPRRVPSKRCIRGSEEEEQVEGL